MRVTKAGVLALAAVVSLTGLSACSHNTAKPMNQTFGKSYVRQLPETETKKKEAEMTSPKSDEKGPAIGGYDTSKKDEMNKKAEKQKEKQNKDEKKTGQNPITKTWDKMTHQDSEKNKTRNQ
jgi:hypothetical protein